MRSPPRYIYSMLEGQVPDLDELLRPEAWGRACPALWRPAAAIHSSCRHEVVFEIQGKDRTYFCAMACLSKSAAASGLTPPACAMVAVPVRVASSSSYHFLTICTPGQISSLECTV